MKSTPHFLLPSKIRRRRLCLLLFALCGALLCRKPLAAQTCNYTVTTLADSGAGSLRAGLADSTATDICFGVSGAISLSSTLQIFTPVTITGSTSVIIDGNNQVQIFLVEESSATDAVRINGLTLTHGNATAGNSIAGGALQVLQGNVTLVGASITSNTAESGGGVYNQATLTLSGCGITNNTATSGAGGGIENFSGGTLTLQNSSVTGNVDSASRGGGVDNGGSLTITGGTFSGNQATQGGAISNNIYYASIYDSAGTLFSSNTASQDGGAIYNEGSMSILQALFTGNASQSSNADYVSCGGAICNLFSANVNESTFTTNTTSGSGGAIQNSSSGYLNLEDDTIVGNAAIVSGSGLDIVSSSSIPTINNTIIAENSAIAGAANSDCNGCVAANGVANLIGVTVNLGPLAINGGPTQTMMPLPGGPAINAGNPSPPGTEGFDATDQRAFSRLSPSGGLDIGAVQTHYSSVSFLAQPSNTLPNQTITPAVAAQVVEVDNSTTNYPQGVPVNISLQDTQGTQVTGALTGTLTQRPTVSNGVTSAVFPNLAINTAGTYKLFATTAISANSASADPTYSGTSASFQIAQPVITWQPAPFPYGPLPMSVLNATATLFGSPATGTFVYTFVSGGATITAGQIYPAGTHPVQVAFTPTGTTIPYTLAATLQINPATPILTWATPAPIFTSTALSATQLDATARGVTGGALPGAFVYNPAAGTTLAAGSQVLKTTFTPTDTANYTTATAQVSIQVNAPTGASVAIHASATTITFGQSVMFTAVVTGTDGQPFSGGTATFTVDGTGIGSATIVNGSGSVTATSVTGGSHQIGVSYTDSSTPQPLTSSTTLTVNKATPTLTWATPAAITTSTALGGTQLDATAAGVSANALTGTFAYTPAAGTMLSVGAHVLSTIFTPSDTVDYTTASAQVTIQVNYSPIAIASVSPSTTALSTSPLPIAIAGSGFTPTSVAEVNGTAVATSVQSVNALTATIPAADLTAAGTLSLSVYDPSSKFTSNIVHIAVTAPAANVTVSVPPTTGSGEQPGITIALNSPYPSDLSGTLALTFAPKSANAVDDPAVQFATGGRTFNFTVTAGTTTTPVVALQTGTVAGTITVTLALTTGGVDVTPPGVSPITLVIAPAAPVITSVRFTNDTAGLITVVINGFSNARDMTQATFVFTGSDAQSLGSAQVQIPVSSLFSPWYSSSTSDQYGSEFTYTQSFQLSKPDSNITGVSATLANSIGTSGSVNSQ
jgi:predicted outer membrane repeat protein